MTYDSQSRLSTMTDPGGGLYQYAYDSQGNLSSVTYPDGASRLYVYDESAFTAGVDQPHSLTGIIDENGVRFATYSYNASGQATHSEHAGGAESITVNYGTPPTVNCFVTATVTSR